MKRPTIKQLQVVRLVAGNGWADGDFAFSETPTERLRMKRALVAFERWIESLNKREFASRLFT